jgi:hypothetical protein
MATIPVPEGIRETAQPEFPAPDLNLSHLRTLTDSTGLLQHAHYSIPRYGEGYCVDDNARALLLMTLLEPQARAGLPILDGLADRYLAFVNHAFNPDLGRFRNFMDYTRAWLEPQGSEDSHGRALWALGATAGLSRDPGRQALAGHLFLAGLAAVRAFGHPRAWAYALLGIQHFLAAFPGDGQARRAESLLAGRLHGQYLRAGGPDWPWFEDRLTYCNARLPQALIRCGARTGRQDWLEAGLRALAWLAEIQTGADGRFAPIGCNGFFTRGQPRARFDQQPVEACATVSAALDAGAASGDPRWRERARAAFGWFLGRNQHGLALYDPRTGGCRDGLRAHCANQNQGAESTLSFLLALVEMRQ